MVFYHQLPEELWFIIYKIEHSVNLSMVNMELKKIHKEFENANQELVESAEFDERVDLWYYMEWIVFRNQRDKMTKWWQTY
tara:strand:- start:2689 stop:2931 length:243 start_codon:yes stop_codon:yes gene_type:complete